MRLGSLGYYFFFAMVGWHLLSTWQDSNLKITSVVLPVHERAVRNCPWVSLLWQNYLRALVWQLSLFKVNLAVFGGSLPLLAVCQSSPMVNMLKQIQSGTLFVLCYVQVVEVLNRIAVSDWCFNNPSDLETLSISLFKCHSPTAVLPAHLPG